MSSLESALGLINELGQEVKSLPPREQREHINRRLNDFCANLTDVALGEIIDGLLDKWREGKRQTPLEVITLNACEYGTRAEKVGILKESIGVHLQGFPR